MSHLAGSSTIELENRTGRSRGRTARVFSVNSKLTESELRVLESAAKREGKTVSEWARELLVKAAVQTGPDVVLVELVATRLMVVNMLKMMSHNLPLTDPELAKINNQVQQSKRRVAADLTEQMKRQSNTKED